MAITENAGGVPATMLVGPAGNSGGFGNGFGGDGWWIILLFILLAGNGGWGGFGGGNVGGAGGLYPWMNQAEITTGGFQNAALNGAISGLQSSVISGFGDVQNAFSQAEIAASNRQMANMNQIFGLSQQFAQCLNKISKKAKEILCFTNHEAVGTLAA